MVIFIINILLSLLMTYFIFDAYALEENSLLSIVIFSSWIFVGWLLSFFYSKNYFKKLPLGAGLVLYFLKELILASLRVTYDVLTPTHHMNPGIIALPLDATSDLEITLLANMITLTPGTLSLDVSDDKKTLYIHEVYIMNGDIEAKKREIKNGFERRILKLTR
jgi:multicomponent Na+:H+ antiporter subunit E